MAKAKKKLKKKLVKGKKTQKIKKTNKTTNKAKKANKTKKVKVAPIPKGYHAVTPYLIVNQGKEALAFYKKAFAAKVTVCMEQPDGKIGHAELILGDSKVMLGDECPEMQAYSPTHFEGSPMMIHLYVKNVDATVKRAVDAGATLVRDVENQFWGDRSGTVKDPFGHTWYISTQVEKLTPAQIKKRAAALYPKA